MSVLSKNDKKRSIHLMAQIFIFLRPIFKKNYSPNNKKYSQKHFEAQMGKFGQKMSFFDQLSRFSQICCKIS
jgi:hypothetical protein